MTPARRSPVDPRSGRAAGSTSRTSARRRAPSRPSPSMSMATTARPSTARVPSPRSSQTSQDANVVPSCSSTPVTTPPATTAVTVEDVRREAHGQRAQGGRSGPGEQRVAHVTDVGRALVDQALPEPAAATSLRSQWIGLGSRRIAASRRMRCSDTGVETPLGSRSPTATVSSRSRLAPQEQPRVGHGRGDLAALAIGQLEPERDPVEDADLAALLALDVGELSADVVGVALAQRLVRTVQSYSPACTASGDSAWHSAKISSYVQPQPARGTWNSPIGWTIPPSGGSNSTTSWSSTFSQRSDRCSCRPGSGGRPARCDLLKGGHVSVPIGQTLVPTNQSFGRSRRRA